MEEQKFVPCRVVPVSRIPSMTRTTAVGSRQKQADLPSHQVLGDLAKSWFVNTTEVADEKKGIELGRVWQMKKKIESVVE